MRRRTNESDAAYARRRRVVRRRLVVGYASAASLFAIAMITFAYAIVTSNGQIGGVGGIVLVTSAVITIVTGFYHAEHYPLD